MTVDEKAAETIKKFRNLCQLFEFPEPPIVPVLSTESDGAVSAQGVRLDFKVNGTTDPDLQAKRVFARYLCDLRVSKPEFDHEVIALIADLITIYEGYLKVWAEKVSPTRDGTQN
jgi:hypothetical protein